MNIIINHTNFPLVYFYIVSFCVIILSSLLFSYFCITAFVFFFFLTSWEGNRHDGSESCLYSAVSMSVSKWMPKHWFSWVLCLPSRLLKSCAVGRVCPPGPPPHVPTAQICSPGSPRHVLLCVFTTPVPVTHVCHRVFLIPLPAVLDSLKSLRSLCLHPLPAHVMLHPFSQSHHGTHFTVSSSPRPRTVHVFLLAGAELTLGRDIWVARCQSSRQSIKSKMKELSL